MLNSSQLKAQKYHEMKELLLAGISFSEALNFSPWNPALKKNLRQGEIEKSFRKDKSLASFDKTLILAFLSMGGLPRAFELLAKYYQQAEEIQKQISRSLSYPLFLLSSVFILSPMPEIIAGKTSPISFVTTSLVPLLVFIFLARFVIIPYLSQPLNLLALKHKLPHISSLPLLKKFLWGMENTLFFLQASYLIESGLSLHNFFTQSYFWDFSTEIKNERKKFFSRYEKGYKLSEIFHSPRFFIPQTSLFLATAEQTGRLDLAFLKCHEIYQSFISSRIEQFKKVFPKIVYLIILGIFVYQLFTSFQGRLKIMDQTLEKIETTF